MMASAKESKRIETNRNKTVTICPAKSKQVKAFYCFSNHMVENVRKKLHFFAPFARNDRIIKDKAYDALRPGQFIKIGCYPGCKQGNKFYPVKAGIIKETVIGIL